MIFHPIATLGLFWLGLLTAATSIFIWIGASPAMEQTGDDYEWYPRLAPEGPVTIVVRVPQQTAYVYRNGVSIARSKISTGMPGHETPIGIFTILGKRREHYSNRYDAAPAPYTQRLTWGGIALHAGPASRYPASHDCIRLPYDFAERLFSITADGMTVIVSNALEAAKAPDALFAPGQEAAESGDFVWLPERSASGPVTVVMSVGDKAVVVLRNGLEIGRAPADLPDGVWRGTRAFMRLEGYKPQPSAVLPDRPALEWLEIPLDADLAPLDIRTIAQTLKIDPVFAEKVYGMLSPGSTVVVTDESIVMELDTALMEAEGPAASRP